MEQHTAEGTSVQLISKIENPLLSFSSSPDAFPLLMTRVHVPPVPINLVARPQLISTLDKAIRQCKLTLLLAPAGSGKTTLLSAWRTAAPGVSMPTAWVSLDERDNDPKHFLAYLLFALQRVQFIEELQQFFPPVPSEPLAEELLIRLLNVITSSITYDFALILDDYHSISSPIVHRALRFLLQHSSPSMHLVISSRVQPPFELTKLRAQGLLWELTSQDLRFSRKEVAAFLNETMGLELEEREIEELDQQTEGWITGLQLAAYTLQKHKRAGTSLETFSRNRRYILDYMATEVFFRQPLELQELLLQTSILEQFNLSLCAAVTGQTNMQLLSALLQQTDIFLIRLDEKEEGWYRYNRLFRDFLFHMLISQHTADTPNLYQRAGAWFEQQGDIPSAIENALAARDFQHAIDLIFRIIGPLLDQCQVALLLKWLFALPDECILESPRLCLVYAWALVFSGITTNVEAYLHKVRLPEIGDERGRQQDIDAAYWQTLMAAMRSYLANCRGDIQQALATSHYALQHLRQVDRHMRTLAILGAGSACWLDGQEAAAIPLFEQAYAENVAVGAWPIAFTAAWALSKIYVAQGYLHKGLACLQQAFEQVERDPAGDNPNLHPSVGMLYMSMGGIFFQWDNINLANHYLLKGLELCQRWDATGVGSMALVDGAINLARMRFLQGKKAEAHEFMALADSAIQHYSLHFYIPLLFKVFRKLLLALSDPQLTYFILSKVPKTSYLYELDQLIEVQLALDVSDFDRASDLLAPLSDQVNVTKRPVNLVEVSLLQALISRGKGQKDQAIQSLSKALSEGSEQYQIRRFVDKGEPLAILLEQTIEARQKDNGSNLANFSLDFTTSILAAFERLGRKGYSSVAPSHQPNVSRLLEPLSVREVDVLHLVVQGNTNQEIAQQLSLALCTVKWHVKNIYGKLQVHNRVQLVHQAQKFGL